MSTPARTSEPAPYPLRIEGHLDAPLSRGLWLVKWLLVLPHVLVLAVLWVAVFVLWPITIVIVAITGRYPRGLFDFVVGVLRWSWRVQFYAYSALGTDRYPPFTLADDPSYPARLDVAYSPRQSRGLALVQWWLLALPHYLLVGIFLGGSTWLSVRGANGNDTTFPGLVFLLVLIAAVTLLFSGRYPRSIFDLVLGLDRWCARVGAYALLLTDHYPPFRLDQGGEEGVVAGGQLREGWGAEAVAAAPHARSGWSGPRIALAVVGTVLALLGASVAAVGGVGLWADQTQRDAASFLGTDTQEFSTTTSALTVEDVDLGSGSTDLNWPRRLLGTVRLRVDGPRPLFVGVGPADDVSRYLADVAHEHITDAGRGRVGELSPGTQAAAPPQQQSFWAASAAGSGQQEVRWEPTTGRWSAVVMNVDGSAGVVAEGDVAARLPHLFAWSVGLLAGGLAVLALGAVLLVLAVLRAARTAPQLPQQGGAPTEERSATWPDPSRISPGKVEDGPPPH